MIQYAVWDWFDRLLNTHDRSLISGQRGIKVPTSPLRAIKMLLENGADFFALSSSGHTILDGLVRNIIEFDGYDRPPEVMASCLSGWLELVQALGFSIKEYIRFEASEQKDSYHHLGLELRLSLRFDEERAPHITTLFQGPKEREYNVWLDCISDCTIWKKWQHIYSLPKPPRPPNYNKLVPESTEIVLIKSASCSTEDGDETCPQNMIPQAITSSTLNPSRKVVKVALYYMTQVARHRHEFSLYVVLLTCLFGCSYLARLLISASFFMVFKILQDVI